MPNHRFARNIAEDIFLADPGDGMGGGERFP